MVDAGLTEDDVAAIRKLAFAGNRFEPFPSSLIPQPTIDRLVGAGLAESGSSCRPAVGAIGYRLTVEGWDAADSFWTWSKPTALMFAAPPRAINPELRAEARTG